MSPTTMLLVLTSFILMSPTMVLPILMSLIFMSPTMMLLVLMTPTMTLLILRLLIDVTLNDVTYIDVTFCISFLHKLYIIYKKFLIKQYIISNKLYTPLPEYNLYVTCNKTQYKCM